MDYVNGCVQRVKYMRVHDEKAGFAFFLNFLMTIKLIFITEIAEKFTQQSFIYF